MTNDWQTEAHISILTKCGIHRDNARKIISMSDVELTDAVAKFEPIQNKTAMQAGLVAAAKAEIEYRKNPAT
jgi:hypothetical protein